MQSNGRRFVIGGREAFLRWCRQHGVDPRDRSVRHVRTERDVLGFRLTDTDEIVALHDADYDAILATESRRS